MKYLSSLYEQCTTELLASLVAGGTSQNALRGVGAGGNGGGLGLSNLPSAASRLAGGSTLRPLRRRNAGGLQLHQRPDRFRARHRPRRPPRPRTRLPARMDFSKGYALGYCGRTDTGRHRWLGTFGCCVGANPTPQTTTGDGAARSRCGLHELFSTPLCSAAWDWAMSWCCSSLVLCRCAARFSP